MRHRKNFNHLSRKTAHRKAMLANMASSLIMHKRIKTTTAKAKALRGFVEPLITRSKEDTTHSRRIVFKELRDKNAVSELFREVAGKVGDRPGGYTRIIKMDSRFGDNADMCLIELVDYNENLLAEKTATRAKSTRRRRGGKKKTEADVVAGVETIEEGAVEEEQPVEDIEDEAVDAENGEVMDTIEEEPQAEEAVDEAREPEAETKEDPDTGIAGDKGEQARAEVKEEAETGTAEDKALETNAEGTEEMKGEAPEEEDEEPTEKKQSKS